ncbi:MAG: DUF3494 domain-containing protein [Bacteroidales bacterium]|nr:DUF3494 domain-containing protein [Bacteroidales bacterium]
MFPIIALLFFGLFAGCNKDDDNNDDIVTRPSVSTTDPTNNATNVFLNKTITVTYSESMDPMTFSETNFILKQNGTSVEGTVSCSGTNARFTPSINLLPNSFYSITITNDVENVSGVSMKDDFVWEFTTGTITAPTVISTNPDDLETSVAIDKVISIEFSEAMNQSTITTSSFKLMLGATIVQGTVNYSGSLATFTPTENLITGTYTASITTEAKNLNNIPILNDYVWSFSTNETIGAPSVNLKTVDRFGIIAGVAVNNNAGFSTINNVDVGIYPGIRTSVTGFPPAVIVNGVIYASDDASPIPAMLIQAKQDLSDAFLFAERASTIAPITVSGDQGGKTLAPGIYKSLSTLLIQSGDLTLDAQGDENAVWIFQIASDFTTVGGAGRDVILTGGAQAKNIFWQTGRSATIGDYTTFKGNILALTSITMNSYAVAEGRMLARNGAVVMTHTNTINKP